MEALPGSSTTGNNVLLERYTGLFGGTGFQGGSFLWSVFLHVEVSVMLVGYS